jgi:hypothetical protein
MPDDQTDALTPTAESGTPLDTRAAVRAELEAARAAYHALLATVPDAGWRRPSANPAWTNAQIVWHLAFNTSFGLKQGERARAGKDYNPPRWLIERANVWITRPGGRRATRAGVAAKYDAAIGRLLAAADGIAPTSSAPGSASSPTGTRSSAR